MNQIQIADLIYFLNYIDLAQMQFTSSVTYVCEWSLKIIFRTNNTLYYGMNLIII